jgi:hypothetical protein
MQSFKGHAFINNGRFKMKRQISSLLVIFSICSLAFSFPLIEEVEARFNNYSSEKTIILSKTEEGFFTENKGQWDSNIYFVGNINSGRVIFTTDGLYYELFKPDELNLKVGSSLSKSKFYFPNRRVVKSYPIKFVYLDTNIIHPKGIDPILSYYNYIRGNDPKNWFSYCRNYREIHYDNLWDGVNLIYSIKGGDLRCKFQINPGAEIEKMKIKLNSAETGDNKIKTSYSSITFSDLYAYTSINGEKINVNFSLIDNIISFNINQDKFNQLKKPLIIDNFLISHEYFITGKNTTENQDRTYIYGSYVYSKLLGGSEDDIAYSMDVDKEGCAYVTGITKSSNFPTTKGVWDSKKSGPSDTFVSKLSSDGSTLIYSTFIGGVEGSVGCEEYEDEIAWSIVVDEEGCAYITGGTICSDFPITPGAISKRHNGNFDVFVTKLSSDGSRLIYSSFLGGKSEDIGTSIALDEENNIYIAGYTDSWNFPTTKGAFQEDRKRTTFGASGFITKISSDGQKIIYSTFLGGSDIDLCFSIALDKEKCVYITGIANSSDFPVTEKAYNKTMNGSDDFFISKLDSNGSTLIYSTFLGGSEGDGGISMVVDEEGCAYVTGVTNSSDFPTTENVWSRNLKGREDIFITKINKDGSNLVYSTFLGGSSKDNWGEESATSIKVDKNGCAYITGGTISPDFPVVESSSKFTGGGDAFILKMNPDGTDIIYSELVGGSELDSGLSIVVRDGKNSSIPGWTSSTDIYIAGITNSFPTENKGRIDAFVRKICLEELKLKKEEIIITLTIGDKEAFINNIRFLLDTPPIIRDGRTLVPLRFIAEAFGAKVDWIPEDQEVIIRYEETIEIHLWVGRKQALIISLEEGLKIVNLDTPPIIRDGRTLVPLRFIAEAFGAKVDWIPEERKVIITHFRWVPSSK